MLHMFERASTINQLCPPAKRTLSPYPTYLSLSTGFIPVSKHPDAS
jgi:hypothetical protein